MEKHRETIIFSELPKLVRETERVSKNRTKKTWEEVPYETDLITGTMLGAFCESFPEPISLKLGLSGWYKVYIALFCTGEESYTYVKLSGRPDWTAARYGRKFAPKMWKAIEYAQEVYAFSADLTGQELQIARPISAGGNNSAVMWVRCVPVEGEEEEVLKAEFRDSVNCTMHMHLDGDISCEDSPKRVEDFCARNYALGESDAEVISQEISFDFSGEFTTSDAKNSLVINLIDKHWNLHDAIYLQKREEIAKKKIQIAHKNGQKIYAANRMQISNFGFPYHRPAWNMEFFEKHPEYRAVWRDGQVMGFCSYAFPEVREYMAEQLVEHLKRGYDGLTLLWNRGMFIGFEPPVKDLFSAKYPEINPCLLPMTDQRLYEVWDELMTEFMRLLRKKVSILEQQQHRKISIHVIGGYHVAEDRKIGLNFARWAKEGLIQEASQADMEMHELLEDCMSDTGEGLIDLEKYRQKGRTQKIIHRCHGTNLEKEIAGMPGYLELEEKWGVKVYHTLPWVHSRRPEEYVLAAKTLYEAGAKRLLMWNTLQCIPDLAEWNVVKRLGHREELDRLCEEQYSQYIKILSVGGMDIRYFNPCWRG